MNVMFHLVLNYTLSSELLDISKVLNPKIFQTALIVLGISTRRQVCHDFMLKYIRIIVCGVPGEIENT